MRGNVIFAAGSLLTVVAVAYAAEPATRPAGSTELRRLQVVVALRQESVDSFKKRFADARAQLGQRYQQQLKKLTAIEKEGTADQQAAAKTAAERTKAEIDRLGTQPDPVLVQLETELAAAKTQLAELEAK